MRDKIYIEHLCAATRGHHRSNSFVWKKSSRGPTSLSLSLNLERTCTSPIRIGTPSFPQILIPDICGTSSSGRVYRGALQRDKLNRLSGLIIFIISDRSNWPFSFIGNQSWNPFPRLEFDSRSRVTNSWLNMVNRPCDEPKLIEMDTSG